ncbi:MAG: DUF402 domain-containing protein [Pyrinomonadaceae bacterium]|nr:DUF402 domain-containing protein [Pyrinomonadaceae bacterium]
MGPRTIKINSRKYDQSIRRSWICDLIEEKDGLVVFVGVFDRVVEHPDLGFIEKGTISYEYYWLDRWYNVFRFHEPDGRLRNWYCNINMPPELSGDEFDYVDLDIDILLWPSGEVKVLDEDEFRENSLKFGYPVDVLTNADAAKNQLLDMIARHEFPFEQLA